MNNNETSRSENTDRETISSATEQEYKYGFVSDIETEIIPRGLSEEVVRLISMKKGEPEWLLDFRLKAYRHWLTMKMPEWAHLKIPEIDYLLCGPGQERVAQVTRRGRPGVVENV